MTFRILSNLKIMKQLIFNITLKFNALRLSLKIKYELHNNLIFLN